MTDLNGQKKDGFVTKLGFVFAAAGSAVGLGNLWKFPYLLGENGGGIFLIVYIIICAIVAFPCCLFESAIGKRTGIASGTQAYAELAEETHHSRRWAIIGFLGVLSCFAMLFYYSVVGGWILDYLFKMIISGPPSPETAEDVFTTTMSVGSESVIWNIVFLAITIIIVLGGIKNGIEKISNFMMPALFVLLIILVIRSVTMPGAVEGIKWMFTPDLSTISEKGIGSVLMAALGQVFFSCSLGIGILITYGAYAPKDQNMIKSSILVPVLDTAVALLAGLAIMPAVFSAGYEPSQGPGLLFAVIPAILNGFGPTLGRVFGIVFFLLAAFAAFTTSVAMVELPVNWIMTRFKLDRKKAVLIDGAIVLVFSILSALSYGTGAVSHISILGRNIFDFFDFISATVMMPVGGFLGAVFVGYILKPDFLKADITNNGTLKFRSYRWYKICVKVLIPVLIFIIFLNGFGIIG